MPKQYNKFGNRTLTIEELTALLPKLNCSREEARKVAKENDIHERVIDMLRSLLGYTQFVPGFLSQETIDKAIQLFLDNPDKSAYRLFIENKDTIGFTDYQKYYQILRKNGIDPNRKRDYWTPIKDKKLLYLRDVQKLSFPKIREQMPDRTVNALQFRYYKLKGYRLPSRDKNNENKT